MRYGHSHGGLVGITLEPSVVKRWALSYHVCAQLRKDMMSSSDPHMQGTVTTHKEEGPSRIQTAVDGKKIRGKLTTCIDFLDSDSHQAGIILNIVTGIMASLTVNVDESVKLGKILMKSYEDVWPESFHKPIV